ncbi:MAG: hypothetical protein M1828_003846 [Chrysothrix sp. TS-e1954]|nr:MAG: hypothetical protein M1828_003846 [Chrysothrix sp. TS-e1954]
MAAAATMQPPADLTALERERIGQPIPQDVPHAISVSVPTWRSVVAYEQQQMWCLSRMNAGYPRFWPHKSISKLGSAIGKKYGKKGEKGMTFPTHDIAQRCVDYVKQHWKSPEARPLRICDITSKSNHQDWFAPYLRVSVVFYPPDAGSVINTFWTHVGEGVSGRRAEYMLELFEEGLLIEASEAEDMERQRKGPKRYQKKNDSLNAVHDSRRLSPAGGADLAMNANTEDLDRTRFVEERFGRNLNLMLAQKAKLAIRRRIAGTLTSEANLSEALDMAPELDKARPIDVEDVYLYPTGMSSIFNTHRILLAARGSMKAICYGFPYVDTAKVLERFGPGSQFYGHGTEEDLDDLERRCQAGEKYLALFCEFPSNPLLRAPNLARVRHLADKYDFAVVIDETIGNFLNVSTMPFADLQVSSLTKIFSGDGNVMGGSCVLNPNSRYYELLHGTLQTHYTDTYWPEDAIFMERNSRDFVSRITRINTNAGAICDYLTTKASSKIKKVFYPKVNDTRQFYDARKTHNGGYGGLLSVSFWHEEDAIKFYDAFQSEKGPSLGTNFTLASPYTLLAHFHELSWAAEFGIEAALVRFSVGLEETSKLIEMFEKALELVPERPQQNGH